MRTGENFAKSVDRRFRRNLSRTLSRHRVHSAIRFLLLRPLRRMCRRNRELSRTMECCFTG